MKLDFIFIKVRPHPFNKASFTRQVHLFKQIEENFYSLYYIVLNNNTFNLKVSKYSILDFFPSTILKLNHK